jgi:hypothetical protein
MSIENNLESIAHSLKLIADLLTVQTATKAVQNAPIPQAPTVAPTPVAATFTPVPAPVVSASPVAVPAAPVMPPAPVFTPAAPTPVATAVSAAPATAAAFPSKQAMMDFVLSSYKALGAEKGARIQQVLEALGHRNINDVPEALWGQLKAGVESLK